jgi:rhamnose transport system permease protein
MPQRDVVETEAGAGEPALGPPATGQPEPVVGTGAAVTRGTGFRWQSLGRWEVALVGFVIATVLFGSAESHYFLSGGDLFDFGLNIGPIALMALPLTFIVMTGEIDLSVAPTLGLACSLLGYLFEHGWPLPLAIVTVLVMGVVTGTFNGILVTHLGLPSLAVTIGTLTLYRGIAEIILGSSSVTNFPNSYDKVGTSPIPGTQLTWTLGIFIVLAVVFGVVLHATPLGRSLFAIGLNKDTAFFSGIRVKRIKLLLYTLSGFICAGAGILWTFQYASSRYDAGTGLELDVVTVVLFGGISIFGGKGTIIGVIMAVCVIGGIQSALTLINVSAQAQEVVTGCLLIISVVLPNSGTTLVEWRAKWARAVPRRS